MQKKKRLNESSKPEKREHNYVEDMTKKGGQLLWAFPPGREGPVAAR